MVQIHHDWREARIARQREIDASIAAKAEFEYLYDKPYEDKKKVRVAGPFTVESLSPHRVLGVDENDDLIGPLKEDTGDWATLNSNTSRPFDKPASGRIAVKVINHLGNEVTKVFNT